MDLNSPLVNLRGLSRSYANIRLLINCQRAVGRIHGKERARGYLAQKQDTIYLRVVVLEVPFNVAELHVGTDLSRTNDIIDPGDRGYGGEYIPNKQNRRYKRYQGVVEYLGVATLSISRLVFENAEIVGCRSKSHQFLIEGLISPLVPHGFGSVGRQGPPSGQDSDLLAEEHTKISAPRTSVPVHSPVWISCEPPDAIAWSLVRKTFPLTGQKRIFSTERNLVKKQCTNDRPSVVGPPPISATLQSLPGAVSPASLPRLPPSTPICGVNLRRSNATASVDAPVL